MSPSIRPSLFFLKMNALIYRNIAPIITTPRSTEVIEPNERGFIRAEVVSYEDLVEFGSMSAVREKGLLRSEGKEYVMKDGDIVLFRFNV